MCDLCQTIFVPFFQVTTTRTSLSLLKTREFQLIKSFWHQEANILGVLMYLSILCVNC